MELNIFFLTVWSWNLIDDIEKQKGISSILCEALWIISNPSVNSNIFSSLCDLEIWWMTSKNKRAFLLYYVKLCASFQIHRYIQTGVTVRKGSVGSKLVIFFVLHYLEIQWITLKNNRAPLLYYIKLCASFQSHEWIQTQVAVRKCPIWVQINKFSPRVTLKFAGWPSKTKGHLTSPMLL